MEQRGLHCSPPTPASEAMRGLGNGGEEPTYMLIGTNQEIWGASINQLFQPMSLFIFYINHVSDPGSYPSLASLRDG